MKETNKNNPVYSHNDSSSVNLSEDEWKKILPEDVYYISRKKGTERPFTSPFETLKDKGTYYCAACGNALFVSDTKFESGCGWPSSPASERRYLRVEDANEDGGRGGPGLTLLA